MAKRALSRDEIEKLDSIWKSPGFVATLIAVAAAFGSWSMLLPVIPLAVLDNGGSDTLAGASTGIFMAATVLTQILTPAALRKFGYNPVMVFSAFMLGAPSLGYLLGMDAGVVLFFSALRGIGFGAITVAESALIAELVPVRFLGKGSGMLGVFIGLSQMIFLPMGLAIGRAASFDIVYGIATVIALVAALMCLRIPRLKAAAKSTPDTGEGAEVPQKPVATWRLVLIPALAVTSLSMSFGAVSSFLPAAVRELDPVTGAVIGGFMLSIAGASAMVFRYLSGVIADRRGKPGATMIPALIIGFLGVALMSLILYTEGSVWWLMLAAVFFGGGFGMVQNEALLSMFFRLPRSKVSEASAIWNISYDAGTGLGSFLLGAAAAQLAYHGAFGIGALIVLVGLALTLADRFTGRRRISERGNTAARLRQLPILRRTVRGARRGRGASRPEQVGEESSRRPQNPGWKHRESGEPDTRENG
ncbi:Major Facilitator Superfamily protein [Corynebacterium occultum]|uniref:Major Facilitator Superfamily protein n=1 Tax=Corynebacterium occultum TaxID=2675219 RepID=A0A6B8VU79_9CORY|nr:MFS transporter [Corynebacterium occultum]QGU07753.1 Major Facilitator Superfamily protein [Corynebacterium occultum]